MNKAWDDAGDLYGIRTSQMDMIAELCRQCEGVLGIKVMGAGFGGNILALVEENSVDELRDLLRKNAQLFSRPVDDSMIVHGLGSGVSILMGPEGDMNWAPLWRNEEV
jgi:galactokinase